MFSSGKKQNMSVNEVIDTIIGENTVIEGSLNTKDTTRIDGKIKGEARSQGFLIIGEIGVVEGDVRAQSLLVAGTVKGNIYVQDRLEVAETGKISGDVVTKTLIIEEGAEFEGKCNMASDKARDVSRNPEKEISIHNEKEQNKRDEKHNKEKAQ